MQRSEINQIIKDAEAFFEEHRFILPPFARWSPEEWKTKGHEADEIRDRHLGWDLTDFGSGAFTQQGLVLFTLRNGNPKDPHAPKTYCEKIMIQDKDQVTPWHFHWSKTEDIINRGGGRLVIEVAWAGADETSLDDRDVELACDGVLRRVPAGGRVVLRPGESVTLPTMLFHQFYGEEGPVLVGEVSKPNDDHTDNCFLAVGRFPEIEEDEPRYRLLCNEYPEVVEH